MKGVTIIETEAFERFIAFVDQMQADQKVIIAELNDKRKPYLTSSEVMKMLGRSSNWLSANKEKIGFSKATGALLFKRKDVEEFIDSDYFKLKKDQYRY